MGVSAFKERFAAAYGMSPIAYRRAARMRAAACLLRSTDRSVASIAAEVGYRNPSKFAAAFFQETGTTPSRYRE